MVSSSKVLLKRRFPAVICRFYYYIIPRHDSQLQKDIFSAIVNKPLSTAPTTPFFKAYKVPHQRSIPREGAALGGPVASFLRSAHKTRNGQVFYKTGIVRGATPCSAGKGQGKTCDEVFPVAGKKIPKGGNRRKRFLPFEKDSIESFMKETKKQNASKNRTRPFAEQKPTSPVPAPPAKAARQGGSRLRSFHSH